MVFAVNGAVANAAEFLSAAVNRPGTMDVQAHFDGRAATLTVTVTDQGAWRTADPATKELKRGRGLPLMHTLADRAAVDSSQAGTRGCLEGNHVPAAGGPPRRRTSQSR